MELLWAYVSCVLYKTQREIRDTDVPIQLHYVPMVHSIIFYLRHTHTHIYTMYILFEIYYIHFIFLPKVFTIRTCILPVPTTCNKSEHLQLRSEITRIILCSVVVLPSRYLLGIPIDICIVLFFYFLLYTYLHSIFRCKFFCIFSFPFSNFTFWLWCT